MSLYMQSINLIQGNFLPSFLTERDNEQDKNLEVHHKKKLLKFDDTKHDLAFFSLINWRFLQLKLEEEALQRFDEVELSNPPWCLDQHGDPWGSKGIFYLGISTGIAQEPQLQ